MDAHYIKHFDFFEHFKKNGRLETEQKTDMDLKGFEKKEYKRLCKEYKDNLYTNDWQKVLSRHLEYSHIQPLGDYKNPVDSAKGEIWMVSGLFLRPGKH